MTRKNLMFNAGYILDTVERKLGENAEVFFDNEELLIEYTTRSSVLRVKIDLFGVQDNITFTNTLHKAIRHIKNQLK